MSDTTHGEDELFDTSADEVVNGDATTGESVDELLDEERKESPKQDAQAVRSKEIALWQSKVDSGMVTPENIPSAQKWVVKHLSLAPKQEENVEDLIETKLAARESEQEYQRLKGQLNSATLTASKKQILQSVFDELKVGVPRHIALKNAILAAGIDLKDQSARKEAMRVPTPGYVGQQIEEDFVPYKFEEDGTYKGPQGTLEQRTAANEKARTGSGANKRDQYRTQK